MEPNGTDSQPKIPKSAKKRINFDDSSEENINEIKSFEEPVNGREESIADEDEQEYEQQSPRKKKKNGLFAGLFSWFGKKKEIIRAKTMKYGARLTKSRKRGEPVSDKSTLSLAATMAMCKKDEKNERNEQT